MSSALPPTRDSYYILPRLRCFGVCFGWVGLCRVPTARVGLELGWVGEPLLTDMETHSFCSAALGLVGAGLGWVEVTQFGDHRAPPIGRTHSCRRFLFFLQNMLTKLQVTLNYLDIYWHISDN